MMVFNDIENVEAYRTNLALSPAEKCGAIRLSKHIATTIPKSCKTKTIPTSNMLKYPYAFSVSSA